MILVFNPFKAYAAHERIALFQGKYPRQINADIIHWPILQEFDMRVALMVEYDGSQYHGWQSLNGLAYDPTDVRAGAWSSC